MSVKPLQHKGAILLLSILPLGAAFAPWDWTLLCFITPFFFYALIEELNDGFWQGFRYGYLMAMWAMVVGFNWVTYVLHEFGELNWFLSGLLFVGFCGIGAFNFPLFFGTCTWLQKRFEIKKMPVTLYRLWILLVIPAIFTIYEYFIPKLFPWYVGHALYRSLPCIQICEWTGSLFLTFAVFSIPASFFWMLKKKEKNWFERITKSFCVTIPLWIIILGVGYGVLWFRAKPDRSINIAMVQANIGSAEKMAYRTGMFEKVQRMLEVHIRLSESALKEKPKPDLIVWPETAAQFELSSDGIFQTQLKKRILSWNTPLVTGAYGRSGGKGQGHNAAFLLTPSPSGVVETVMYPKMIMLAFGEYMPFGDWFPFLYDWFPTVAHWEPGKDQMAIPMADGTKLGMTVCYEAIVPDFVRKVAAKGAHIVLNLTNDSWFGPTSEPFQHAQLAMFRAVETRLPLVRVTNTGTSIVVDSFGNFLEMTPIFQPTARNITVPFYSNPRLTFYVRMGEWFLALCMGGVAVFLYHLAKRKG